MVALNNSNANVFYWPLSTGNKINTAYNIVPKLAKFFIAYVKNTRDFSHGMN